MVRFLADADLNHTILLATVRKQPGIDFLAAREAGLAGLSDREVLARAAADQRILVSHDFRTMPTAFAAVVGAGSASSGVILVGQDFPIALCAEQLTLVWAASEPADWVNRLAYLPL